MSETTIDSTLPTTSAKPEVKPIEVGRFNGAFKLFASRFYNDAIYYGINKKVAHKVANDAMSNLGLAMAQDADLSAKISKANKNGDGKFKLSGSSGLTTTSNAMMLLRLVQQLESLREEKLLCKPLRLDDLQDFLKPEVSKYLDECESWANSVKWAE